MPRLSSITSTLVVIQAALAGADASAQSFTLRTISFFSDRPLGALAADLNGDGVDDFVVANVASQDIRWNQGRNPFPGPSGLVTTSNQGLSEIEAADLDGDGDLDIVSIAAFGGEVLWHQNLGDGSFAPPTSVSGLTGGALGLDIEDLDGDGVLDVVVAQGGVIWFRGLGTGFSLGESLPGALPGTGDVDAADVDGDGDVDVLYASGSANEMGWFENLGAGVFAPAVIIGDDLEASNLVDAADLDGDGDLDLIATSRRPAVVRLYEKNAAGIFVDLASIQLGDQFANVEDLEVVDMDLDGLPDLVFGMSSIDSTIRWIRNQGPQGFSAPVTLGGVNLGAAYGVAVSDFDGDGDPDIGFGDFGGRRTYWLRNELTAYDGVGTRICWPAEVNSTGLPSDMRAVGSASIVANGLGLEAAAIPPNTFGIFIAARTELKGAPFLMNSSGRLCIGPEIGRGVGGAILDSGAAGMITTAVDFSALPTPSGPVQVLTGETWFFQAWFRDSGPAGPTSNTSNAIRVPLF